MVCLPIVTYFTMTIVFAFWVATHGDKEWDKKSPNTSKEWILVIGMFSLFNWCYVSTKLWCDKTKSIFVWSYIIFIATGMIYRIFW